MLTPYSPDVAVSRQLLLELYVQVPDIVDLRTDGHMDGLSGQIDGSVTQRGISQVNDHKQLPLKIL